MLATLEQVSSTIWNETRLLTIRNVTELNCVQLLYLWFPRSANNKCCWTLQKSDMPSFNIVGPCTLFVLLYALFVVTTSSWKVTWKASLLLHLLFTSSYQWQAFLGAKCIYVTALIYTSLLYLWLLGRRNHKSLLNLKQTQTYESAMKGFVV